MSERVLACPRCESGKSPKLYINTDKQQFICFRCENFKGTLGYLLTQYPQLSVEIDTAVALEATSRYKRFLGQPSTYDILEDLNPVQAITVNDLQYKYLLDRGWSDSMILTYAPLKSLNDRYADRVILPIYNTAGELIYFTARSIVSNGSDKYLNSPVSKDGVLFKSNVEEAVLYKNVAVVCEGIFDSAKIPNAIALMGKSLAGTQMDVVHSVLSKSRDIYIALDAGAEVDMRSIAHTLRTMFPSGKRIFVLNTFAYETPEIDLGDMTKTMTSIELIEFIKANSTEYVNVNTLQSKLHNRLKTIIGGI